MNRLLCQALNKEVKSFALLTGTKNAKHFSPFTATLGNHDHITRNPKQIYG